MNNQNNLSGLDPKLREAYERVMGTNVPKPTTTPPPQPSPVPPSVNTTPAAKTANTSMPTSIPQPTVGKSQFQTLTATPSHEEKTEAPKSAFTSYQSPAVKAAAKPKVSTPILVIGSVVFFIVYALLWIKLFNLQLPF